MLDWVNWICHIHLNKLSFQIPLEVDLFYVAKLLFHFLTCTWQLLKENCPDFFHFCLGLRVFCDEIASLSLYGCIKIEINSPKEPLPSTSLLWGCRRKNVWRIHQRELIYWCSKFLHMLYVEVSRWQWEGAVKPLKGIRRKLRSGFPLFMVPRFSGKPTWLQTTKQDRNLSHKPEWAMPTFWLRILCSSINFAFPWHNKTTFWVHNKCKTFLELLSSGGNSCQEDEWDMDHVFWKLIIWKSLTSKVEYDWSQKKERSKIWDCFKGKSHTYIRGRMGVNEEG